MGTSEAMDFLLDKLRLTETNDDFLPNESIKNALLNTDLKSGQRKEKNNGIA